MSGTILALGDSITGWSDLSRWMKWSHILEAMVEARCGQHEWTVINRGIGSDFRAIKVEFFAPDQTCCDTQLNNVFKETLKDFQAIAVPDFAQAAVVRHRLVQVITDLPAVV